MHGSNWGKCVHQDTQSLKRIVFSVKLACNFTVLHFFCFITGSIIWISIEQDDTCCCTTAAFKVTKTPKISKNQ